MKYRKFYNLIISEAACADQESFVRGGPTLTDFFTVVL